MKRDVIFLIDNVYSNGGMARVTLLIISNLLKLEKYQITLISMCKSGQKSFYDIPEACKVIYLPFCSFRIRRDTLKVARELRKLFKADFSGTFVVDDVGHNIPAWLGLKHCKKATFISWSHMNFFNGSKYGFSGVGKRLAVKRFDSLISLTKEDMEYYHKILGAKNVVQIYNPIDSQIVKQDYNVHAKKIISCGRLNIIKGFDMLIDVAKKVFEKVEDWQWDIYGDGPERDNLQRKIEEYDLVGKVNLLGYHSEMLSLYKDYSFCVFTSRGEGCPMAMIEAMSAGLPMISFDFKCGPQDLITDGVNGYIIKDWNLNEMSERILGLINNQELRVQFADKADLNLKEFELDYVMKKWDELLSEKL